MTSFSERLGITQPKTIQLNDMDVELRNSLWNVCRGFFFIPGIHDVIYLAVILYRNYHKKPVETIPPFESGFVEQQLLFFQSARWFEVLNIVEFLHTQCLSDKSTEQRKFERQINEVLEREKSAYRFIVGKLAPITNET